MKRKVLALLSAGVLAVAGVFALVNYANGANERAFDGARLVDVLVVKNEIPTDTPADRLAGNVKTVQVPTTVRAKGALTSLDEVKGLSTNTALKPGEQLLESRFGAVTGKGAVSQLPAGMQEVSIAVTAPRIVGGELRVGDKVGILVSYLKKGDIAGPTTFLKQNVLVTRVGSASAVGQAASDVGLPVLVTLAVETLDAEKLVNASEFGKVWLTLQNSQTDTSGARPVEPKDVIK
jgi:pilus assembly protein CpaB